MIKIGHASIDENGKIIGGQVGDQTKKEICIRTWYDHPWNVYLECPDKAMADKAATIMEQICANNKIGYDQSQRTTAYTSIVQNNGNVALAQGELDCSSCVSTCYKLAGLNISPDNTTRSLKAVLIALGFKAYTDAEHLKYDRYATRGGIYLSEGHHVVMALENGSAVPKEFTVNDAIDLMGKAEISKSPQYWKDVIAGKKMLDLKLVEALIYNTGLYLKLKGVK